MERGIIEVFQFMQSTFHCHQVLSCLIALLQNIRDVNVRIFNKKTTVKNKHFKLAALKFINFSILYYLCKIFVVAQIRPRHGIKC